MEFDLTISGLLASNSQKLRWNKFLNQTRATIKKFMSANDWKFEKLTHYRLETVMHTIQVQYLYLANEGIVAVLLLEEKSLMKFIE